MNWRTVQVQPPCFVTLAFNTECGGWPWALPCLSCIACMPDRPVSHAAATQLAARMAMLTSTLVRPLFCDVTCSPVGAERAGLAGRCGLASTQEEERVASHSGTLLPAGVSIKKMSFASSTAARGCVHLWLLCRAAGLNQMDRTLCHRRHECCAGRGLGARRRECGKQAGQGERAGRQGGAGQAGQEGGATAGSRLGRGRQHRRCVVFEARPNNGAFFVGTTHRRRFWRWRRRAVTWPASPASRPTAAPHWARCTRTWSSGAPPSQRNAIRCTGCGTGEGRRALRRSRRARWGGVGRAGARAGWAAASPR